MLMRELFHVPENYFLTHSVGCLPKQTETELRDYFFAPWMSGENWADWMPILDEFRAGLAAMLSVEKATICPQVNVSSALTKILYSLPENRLAEVSGRKIILLSKQDFPTIGFVFKQAKRFGYQIRFVEGDPSNIENWQEALDETIAIVHITHALSNRSHLLPVDDICALAQGLNIISIVDVAQSLGAVPVNLAQWGADFAMGTGVKFLCFGPGACFLYASPEMLRVCNPLDVGWFSHEKPFEMDIEKFRFAPDAMRYFGGTPSPAPFVMGNSAMKLWQSLGAHRIQRQIEERLSYLCEKLPSEIIVSPTIATDRGGTFVIAPGAKDLLRQTLEHQNIFHDEREEGFRFSVHAYTSDSEVENLAGVLLSARP